MAAVLCLEGAVRCFVAPVRWTAFRRSNRFIRLVENLPYHSRELSRAGIGNGMDGATRFRTDADGFILPDLTDPRRPADIAIAFLGGSTTESALVKEDLRWPYLVAKDVSGLTGLNVRALNAGVSGTNVHHSVNVYMNKVIPHRPAIVVMMHAWNDCGLLMQRGTYDDWSVQSPWVERHRYVLGWRALYDLVSSDSALFGLFRHFYVAYKNRWSQSGQAHQPVHVTSKGPMTVPVAEFQSRIEILLAIIRAADATPILMTEPFRGKTTFSPSTRQPAAESKFQCTALLNDRLRLLARRKAVQLIDLERKIVNPAMFFDDVHETDAGSVAIASIVSREIAPVVASVKGGSRPWRSHVHGGQL